MTDAAILLGVLERRGARSERSGDDARARRRPAATTRGSCSADGAEGARIGIPRAFFYDRLTPPGRGRAAASTPEQAA